MNIKDIDLYKENYHYTKVDVAPDWSTYSPERFYVRTRKSDYIGGDEELFLYQDVLENDHDQKPVTKSTVDKHFHVTGGISALTITSTLLLDSIGLVSSNPVTSDIVTIMFLTSCMLFGAYLAYWISHGLTGYVNRYHDNSDDSLGFRTHIVGSIITESQSSKWIRKNYSWSQDDTSLVNAFNLALNDPEDSVTLRLLLSGYLSYKQETEKTYFNKSTAKDMLNEIYRVVDRVWEKNINAPNGPEQRAQSVIQISRELSGEYYDDDDEFDDDRPCGDHPMELIEYYTKEYNAGEISKEHYKMMINDILYS